MVNNDREGLFIMFNEYRDLLTVEETCEALGIGRNLCYILLSSGEIKAFKCGRVWKIPREAVEKFIRLRSGL